MNTGTLMLRTTVFGLGAIVMMAGAALGPRTASFAHAAAPAGAGSVQRTVAVSGAAEDFLAAAALRSLDLPGGLSEVANSYLSLNDAAALGGGDVAQSLSDNGFVAGYDQGFRSDNLLSILSGAPAAAGTVITLFSSSSGASSWNSIEAQSAVPVAEQIATASGAAVSIDSSIALTLPALGDESSGVELQGTGTISGQSVAIYVDIAFIRRGPAQYTVLAAGLQSQQRALVSMATALDSRVAAALPLVAAAGAGTE